MTARYSAFKPVIVHFWQQADNGKRVILCERFKHGDRKSTKRENVTCPFCERILWPLNVKEESQ